MLIVPAQALATVALIVIIVKKTKPKIPLLYNALKDNDRLSW
ncbi:MAG: hypothetical protein QNJ41_29020 [Xenococcaceae cyanobacterium MO_188.B32]|nr:hypothetical protein [Xenococcaceae cyanobacterium MO_188.B32]